MSPARKGGGKGHRGPPSIYGDRVEAGGLGISGEKNKGDGERFL